MKIITWVYCEDCFRHDYKYHETPNLRTTEVNITAAKRWGRDTIMATFDCLNCKEQGRKYRYKNSLVQMTTDQPHDDSGITHPYV
jgi:hypothetical protein